MSDTFSCATMKMETLAIANGITLSNIIHVEVLLFKVHGTY